MTFVPTKLRPAFHHAGWFEGRNVVVDPAVPRDHPAHAVLAELNGLAVPHPAPNIEMLAFEPVSEAASLLARLEAALRTRLVGIAELDGGHAELYVAAGGQLIGCSLVHSACWLVGRTVARGLAAMADGDRSRPILLPGDGEVSLYGQVFAHGDAAVVGVDAPEFG